MAKKKKIIELEDIPLVLQKVASLIDREVESLSAKPSLTFEDSKNLIAYSSALSTIYKDYRAEVSAIQKNLKDMSKDEIMSIISAESIN